MKTNYKLAVAIIAGITLGAVPQGYAQGPGAHSTVTPDQLEWKDVPALGPGVKLALIEGPMNEAVPYGADQVSRRGQGPPTLASSD